MVPFIIFENFFLNSGKSLKIFKILHYSFFRLCICATKLIKNFFFNNAIPIMEKFFNNQPKEKETNNKNDARHEIIIYLQNI